MRRILEALMSLDGFSEREAKEELARMHEEVNEGNSPEGVLWERGLDVNFILEF